MVNGAGLGLIFRLAEFAALIVAVWAEGLIETSLFNLTCAHRSHGFFPLSQDSGREDTTHGKRRDYPTGEFPFSLKGWGPKCDNAQEGEE